MIEMKGVISITLITVLLASIFMPLSSVVYAKDVSSRDNALILMAMAHGNIEGIDSIDKLKSIQKNYKEYYKLLEKNALNDDQKVFFKNERDIKDEALDKKINELRTIRDKKNRNSFGRKLGRFFRCIPRKLGKGTKWIGKKLGEGISITVNTVIDTLPKSPDEILKFAIITLSTGGASNFKSTAKKIFKTNFKKALRKKANAEILKIAYKNKTIRILTEFNKVAGNKLGLSEDYYKGIDEYISQQDAIKKGDEEGFLYIKGTCTILNENVSKSFEYKDYAQTTAVHLLDYTFAYDFKSVKPLN